MGENKSSKDGMHRAKIWQIFGLAMNDVATNLYMWEMIFISYYLNGILGVGVVLASTFVTIMRVWDGVTDPIIGLILDKTNGKFGKNRPFLVIGQLIMLVMSAMMFFVTPKFPQAAQFLVFIVFYAVYIIGYTCQCVVTKSAQSCLTNDPSQRPIYGMFYTVLSGLFFMFAPMYTYTYLLQKHHYQFDAGYFSEMWGVLAILSAAITVFVVFAISGKDKSEYYGIGKESKPMKLADYWDTLKNNKALQMLVVAASTDKLALQTRNNATISIIVYAIVCGNAAVSGLVASYVTIPGMVLSVLGINFIARKFGQKKGVVVGSWGGIVTTTLILLLFIFGNTNSFSLPGDGVFAGWTLFTVLLIGLSIIQSGFSGVASGLVYPMTADVVDYEVYRTKKYAPGMIGTLFSFVDKLISSLASMVVGLLCAAIGFREALPTVETPYSPALKAVGLFCMFGMVMFGYICNVIAMHHYPLNKEKMSEIQSEIAKIKEAA